MRRAKIEIRHNRRLKQPYWVALVGANGEVMSTTERFSSRADAMRRAKRMLAVAQSLNAGDIVVEA